jgi:N-alpha-acetyltransferase 15/16, NatA auxiliary subunit
VNNKATKYYLRADRVEEAMNTIAMFTKHDGDSQQTLFDLQCIWYELEVGESYARKGFFGPALKKFYAIEKHFTDFVEDQFDFHAFSIRKVSHPTQPSPLLHLLIPHLAFSSHRPP